ncbi:MAG TPA: cation-transporting P-type ATPase, partial [Vicinamibacteria bacterium]
MKTNPGPRAAEDGYWALTALELAGRLGSSADGLSQAEALARLRTFGPNRLRSGPAHTRLRVLLAQLRSPLLFLLIFAASISALTGEWLDAVIVVLIVLASAGFGYSREWSAQSAVAALQAQIRTKARVVRDGRPRSVPVEEVVPGDVVELGAGTLVPADARILEAASLFV